jgi:N-acyl homoserine lactone hydrolase
VEVVPLVFGWEVVPRGLSLEGGGDEPVREPVTGALVRIPGWGALLVDTGMTPDDPPGLAALYPHGAPERRPLREVVDTEEVRAVALSHLHLDHTGGLRCLDAPVWVSPRERAWAEGRGIEEGVWPADWSRVREWRDLGDGTEVAPGVRAVSTPGHTPGHMSFAVGDDLLLACDAIDLTDGIELDREIGAATDDDDPAARRASHDRLMALHRAGVRVVPGHCPRAWAGSPW